MPEVPVTIPADWSGQPPDAQQPDAQPLNGRAVVPVPATALSAALATHRPTFWLVGLCLAGVAGLITWLLGLTPWLLVAVALVAIALALAQWSNLRVGITGSLLATLGAYSVLVRFFPHLGLGLSLAGALSLGLAIAGSVALLFWRWFRGSSPGLVLPNRRAGITAGMLLGAALVLVIGWISWQTARGNGPVWAMLGDSMGQMIKVRQIIANGGVNTAVAQNSSPLTSALMAMASIVGRPGTGPQGSIQNDVLRSAELWALMIFATGILAALITWRATAPPAQLVTDPPAQLVTDPPAQTTDQAANQKTQRGTRPVFRVLAAIIAGAVPMTWYFSGFALIFGFYNSTLTLLILLAAWHIWLESPGLNPVLTTALLSLATIAMLATWAPVALIPAGLAALVLVRTILLFRSAGALSLRQVLPLVIAALPIPLYGLLVSLADFAYEGGALAGDGGIMPVPGWHTFWVLVLVALVMGFITTLTREWYVLWGLGVVYTAGLIGLVFLVWKRISAGFPFPPTTPAEWGYYPIKMAWGLTSLLIVIGLISVVSYLVTKVESSQMLVLSLVLAVAATGALMMQIGPWRLLFTPIDIIRSLPAGPAEAPWRANVVFDADVEDRATILVRYTGNVDVDRFANSWLLQAFTTRSDDPMRPFAFWLDPHDDQQVCDAIYTWYRPVTVLTHDPSLEYHLRAACPDANFTVLLPLSPN